MKCYPRRQDWREPNLSGGSGRWRRDANRWRFGIVRRFPARQNLVAN
jgi:hypothetical protein